VKNSGVTSPLVSTTELAVSLSGAEPPVLLDVRWRLGGPPGREDYERGHIPGAVFLDLDADLAAPPGPAGRHPLPAPADLQRVLRTAGVRTDAPVVAYDADNGSIAARVWWLLRWAGHDRVSVLDGGYTAWVTEGRPVTTDAPTPEPGDVTVRPGHMPVADADGAAELARSGVLLDARAPERYRGDVEPVDPRAGHVPSAHNAPFAAHTGDDGRWRTPAELADHFAKVGLSRRGGSDRATGEIEGAGGTVGPEAAAPTEGVARPSAGVAERGVVEPAMGAVEEPAGAAGGAGLAGLAEGAVEEPAGAAEGAGLAGLAEGAVEEPAGAAEGVGVAGPVVGEGEPGAGVVGAERTAGSFGEVGSRVGVYCGSGVTATSVVLALEVAGITTPDVPAVLYAGSWSNWSADPSRPVATGDEAAAGGI
jgi:thiosulfate/3-mercaptopyruvate sulfurtransferase